MAEGDWHEQGERFFRAGSHDALDHGHVTLGAVAAGLARHILLQQNHVDVRIGLQCVDGRPVGVGAGEHAEAAVDGIADQRADAEHFSELGGRLLGERRQLQIVLDRGIEQKPAQCARERNGAEPPSDRRIRMHQKLGDLHGIVQRLGANNAKVCGDRVKRLGGAGERAGMRHRGAAAAL